MNIATIVAAVCSSAIVLSAPPKQPSWWVEKPTKGQFDALLVHGRDAEEITLDDMKLMFTLQNEYFLVIITEAYIEDKIKNEPDRRMSWDDVKFELKKIRATYLKTVADIEEQENKKNSDAANGTT
jgi:hypothetical protein